MKSIIKNILQIFNKPPDLQAQRMRHFLHIIEADDPLAIEAARDDVLPSDLPHLIAHYWQQNSWSQKRALVELLQDQHHPDLPKLMLDFLRAPVIEGDEQMELAQAIALGYVDEAYDQFMVYYNDRTRLRQDVQAVLLQKGILAELPTQSEKRSAQLPQSGVDPTSPPNRRLLEGAVLGDLLAVQQALIDGAAIDDPISSGDYVGCNALIMSLMRQRFEVASYLIQHRADVNYKRPATFTSPDPARGQTPLWWAACQGHIQLAQLLVNKGASINTPDHFGSTPFVQAASSGHLEMVRFLVQHGADIHAQIYDGRKGFHLAVTHGHLPVIEYLLDLGCDPNEPGGSGYTPLMVAAENNSYALAQLLIQHGADVNAVHTGQGMYIGLKGWTPLVFAVHASLVRMTKLLIQSGANVHYIVPAGHKWDGQPLPARRITDFATGKRAESVLELLREAGAR
ncbi:MAG: ankyrin repeat domain-containing protein [Anaerolineales bacterium]|nr:ankyrin repeat domain-containing protein [Anaerolineales bacterium]